MPQDDDTGHHESDPSLPFCGLEAMYSSICFGILFSLIEGACAASYITARPAASSTECESQGGAVKQRGEGHSELVEPLLAAEEGRGGEADGEGEGGESKQRKQQEKEKEKKDKEAKIAAQVSHSPGFISSFNIRDNLHTEARNAFHSF